MSKTQDIKKLIISRETLNDYLNSETKFKNYLCELSAALVNLPDQLEPSLYN